MLFCFILSLIQLLSIRKTVLSNYFLSDRALRPAEVEMKFSSQVSVSLQTIHPNW